MLSGVSFHAVQSHRYLFPSHLIYLKYAANLMRLPVSCNAKKLLNQQKIYRHRENQSQKTKSLQYSTQIPYLTLNINRKNFFFSKNPYREEDGHII